ncbi:glycoside hydrolase family 16 protein [Hyaloscypha variabilis]
MSTMLLYSETQQWEMDLLNTDKPETAWLATLFAGEFPNRSLGVNYSTLGNTSLSNYTSSPWAYVELKVDWDPKSLNYSIGGVVSRNITRKQDTGIPSIPGPLLFKHWCDILSACSIADTSLRGSIAYNSAATAPWRETKSNFRLKIFAIVIVSLGSAIGALVLINARIRRIIERRAILEQKANEPSYSSRTEDESSFGRPSESITGVKEVPPPGSASSSTTGFSSMGHATVSTGTHTAVTSRAPSISQPSSPAATIVGPLGYSLPLQRHEHQELNFAPAEVDPLKRADIKKTSTTMTDTQASKVGTTAITTVTEAASTPKPSSIVVLQGGKPRIDYMAGMVAICALMVTIIHYALTFLPALDSGYNAHYRSEIWGSRILAPYFLNAAWLGLFFTTSTRFLTVGYLRSGNLRIVAEKTVTRPFRLIIPVAGVVILEYFLIDCGATKWLEYLPSITWSTWPYTVRYTNFGEFLNELLELLYMIPNASPQITFNYCTGVLWTIPVTLQGSWISLLGVMIIYELKNPWKRFSYYTLCILMNWYAREWGSYFWAGLILADLDVIYKYTKYIYARPLLHWFLLITCFLTAFAMLTWDALLIDADIPLLALERGIHPDLKTGRPIAQTENKGYPAYFEPRLNGLIFASVVQLGVEISPFTQKLLSSRILMWIFPHIFTIYLFHGLIFWALGSVIVVQLSAVGLPCWAVMLVNATACWGTLFLLLPVVTPAIEILGKGVTASIWRFGVEGSAKKEGTLWPFEKELLLGRLGANPHVSAREEPVVESRFSVDKEGDGV